MSTGITDSMPAGPRVRAEGPSAGTGHANFGRLVASEWTKLRTVRSTIWSFAALIVVALGLTVLITSLTEANWSQAKPAQTDSIVVDPVGTIFGAALYLGQLAICVLGAMVATNEYSTGMIRSTLLASPHRVRTLLAKAIAFVIPTVIIGEIVGFATFEIGSAILKPHAPVSLSDPHVMRAVVGVGLYLGMLGLFALAIGQIFRHTAGAITGTIALVLVLVPISGLLPGSFGKHVAAYLPTNAGQQLLDPVPTSDPGPLLSAWEGFAVFGVWTALLLAIAAWTLVERDA